jgi:TDG/mug DNA glycosylase family protein
VSEHKRLEYGIGLTDLVKRVSGAGSELSKQNFDIAGLEAKILNNSPEVLCFNEKKAAQEYMGTKQVEYGLQNIKIGETLIFVAPFTSGVASGYWDENFYFELARIV